MKKEMLINVLQPEECRIAIVEDGQLEELYVERASQESYVGNIYKGRIVNIEPSIQAAFVDFGIGRNGFLHVSDVDPVYYKHLLPKEVREAMEAEEEDGPPPPRRREGGREGGRDRDRGPRVARPESVTTLPAEAAPAGAAFDDEDAGFGTGLDDDQPPAPAPAPKPAASYPATPKPTLPIPVPTARELPPPADDGDFGAGLDDDAPPPAPAPAPKAAAPRPAPAPVVPPPPVPAPAAVAEDDGGFGEGIDLDDGTTDAGASGRLSIKESIANVLKDVAAPIVEAFSPPPPAAEPEKEEPAAEDSGSVPAAEDSGVIVAEGDAEKPAKKRPARKPAKDAKEPKAKKPKAAEAAEEAPKKRPARKKKADGDDAPGVMGAAEHRTRAGDDEPEIRPFFEGGDDFDPDAPNDRFGEGVADDDAPPSTLTESDEADDTLPPSQRDREGRGERDRGGRGDRDRGGRGRGGRDRGERRGDRERERFNPPPDVEDEEGGEVVAAPSRPFGDDEEDEGFAARDRGPRRDRGERGDRDRRSGGRNGDRRGGPSRGGPPARDRGYPRPPIQEIFKRGQEVIVQVIKEGIGTKGPTLSTFISIAGRYLVLMPSLNRVGVSRKIEDPESRRRLRDIMNDLNPPKGVGFIVRTAAIEQNEADLANDLQYLLRLWQVVVRRIKKMQSPVELYRESDMITRTIRDILSPDIESIWVDEEAAFNTASDFLQVVMPRFASKIKHYDGSEPLFHKYNVEGEIAKINQKRLDLPQGGSIIIEQTEALVAIDVNSGTFRADNKDAEETAFRMNMLAAKEIARQLRLRDLGGVIVNDFIDMRDEKHRRKVEDTLRDALLRDRARTKILRISQFGIIEMTRQRIQPSLKKRIYNDCPHCAGTGYVKTNETMAIELMRLLHLAAHRAPGVAAVQLGVHMEVAFYLLNRKRREIAALEARSGIEVAVHGQLGVSPDLCEFKCYDSNGGEVRLLQGPPPRMFAPGGRPPRLPERGGVRNLD